MWQRDFIHLFSFLYLLVSSMTTEISSKFRFICKFKLMISASMGRKYQLEFTRTEIYYRELDT